MEGERKLSENKVSKYLVMDDHRKESPILRKIVKIFKEWMDALQEDSTEWPRLIAGPWSLGSGLGHKIFMIIEGTDEQVKHMTFKFYKYIDLSYDRCFEVMAETPEKLEEVIKKYELEET
jgi:hypothetical protein